MLSILISAHDAHIWAHQLDLIAATVARLICNCVSLIMCVLVTRTFLSGLSYADFLCYPENHTWTVRVTQRGSQPSKTSPPKIQVIFHSLVPYPKCGNLSLCSRLWVPRWHKWLWIEHLNLDNKTFCAVFSSTVSMPGSTLEHKITVRKFLIL